MRLRKYYEHMKVNQNLLGQLTRVCIVYQVASDEVIKYLENIDTRSTIIIAIKICILISTKISAAKPNAKRTLRAIFLLIILCDIYMAQSSVK